MYGAPCKGYYLSVLPSIYKTKSSNILIYRLLNYYEPYKNLQKKKTNIFSLYTYTGIYLWHRFNFFFQAYFTYCLNINKLNLPLFVKGQQLSDPSKIHNEILHNRICDFKRQWFSDIEYDASYPVDIFLLCMGLCIGRYKFIVLHIRYEHLVECILIKMKCWTDSEWAAQIIFTSFS